MPAVGNNRNGPQGSHSGVLTAFPSEVGKTNLSIAVAGFAQVIEVSN